MIQRHALSAQRRVLVAENREVQAAALHRLIAREQCYAALLAQRWACGAPVPALPEEQALIVARLCSNLIYHVIRERCAQPYSPPAAVDLGKDALATFHSVVSHRRH